LALVGQHIRSADWKTEKHVPAIECPDRVQGGQPFEVALSVGKVRSCS